MQINTLITDIYAYISANPNWFWHLTEEFGDDLEAQGRVQREREKTRTPSLYLSKLGPQCPCALWHSIHSPGEAERLPPWASFKYAYGHTIEALAIILAKKAGHEVTGEQDVLTVAGVKGRRDCVIDGCVVDVKSAASRSYLKFKDGSIKNSDTFGYLEQLDGYVLASADDPLVRVKDRGYLFAIDKQLGHMCLYEHRARPDHIARRVDECKQIVALPSAPRCTCGVIADGESGNECLDLRGSYNAYKYCCKPHLRTFLYSDGPRYLTKVVKRPKNKNGPIIEIDRYGKVVYT